MEKLKVLILLGGECGRGDDETAAGKKEEEKQ